MLRSWLTHDLTSRSLCRYYRGRQWPAITAASPQNKQGKSSTNIIPQKSLEPELQRTGCSAVVLPLKTPQAYPSPGLDIRGNCLQTALSICLLGLTLEVTDLTLRNNLWIFTHARHPLMVKRFYVQAIHFRVKSSGGLCYYWCQDQH